MEIRLGRDLGWKGPPLTRIAKIIEQVGMPDSDAHDVLWCACNAWEDKVGDYVFEVLKLENNACYLRANQKIIRTPSMCSDGGKIKGWPKGGGGYGVGSGKGKGWSKRAAPSQPEEEKWGQAAAASAAEWW